MVDGQSGIPKGKGEKATPPNAHATGQLRPPCGAAAGCLAGELGKWAAQGQRGRVGETGTRIGTS